MELCRDSKITHVSHPNIDVKDKEHEGPCRIKFCINGIMFITEKPFDSESEFYDSLILGNDIPCKHVFEMDMIDCEEIKSYNIGLEENYVVIFKTSK